MKNLVAIVPSEYVSESVTPVILQISSILKEVFAFKHLLFKTVISEPVSIKKILGVLETFVTRVTKFTKDLWRFRL